MSDAFLGEIRIFAGNFAPVDWAFCNGQLLPISQYTALFSILGTRFGGNGQTNFALPNLGGAAPMGQGTGNGLTPRDVGELVGTQTVTLATTDIPSHSHTPMAVADGTSTSTSPANAYWAEGPAVGRGGVHPNLYNPTPNVQMSPYALGVAGNNMPHNNMQPYLSTNFIICLNGIFPPRQ